MKREGFLVFVVVVEWVGGLTGKWRWNKGVYCRCVYRIEQLVCVVSRGLILCFLFRSCLSGMKTCLEANTIGQPSLALRLDLCLTQY